MKTSDVRIGVIGGAVGCLVVIGLCVIIATSALHYFGEVQRGGTYDRIRSQLNQSQMTALYSQIETYKLQYGSYPGSLSELVKALPKGSLVFLYDASAPVSKKPQKFREFFYSRVGCDHYYLRAEGLDAIPFTPDDDLPKVEDGAVSKLGLLMTRNVHEPKECSAP